MSRMEKFESVAAAADAAQKAWAIDGREKTPILEVLLTCSASNKAWIRFYYRTRVVRDDRVFGLLHVFEAEIKHDSPELICCFGDPA